MQYQFRKPMGVAELSAYREIAPQENARKRLEVPL